MPRWFQATLYLVLFAAAMQLVRWALHALVPDGVAWLDFQLGSQGTWMLLLGGWAALAAFGFWPRHPDGTAKRLLPRRG